MRGGKRINSGRKADPSKQVRLKCKLLDELAKVPGETVSEKIEYLFTRLKSDKCKREVELWKE